MSTAPIEFTALVNRIEELEDAIKALLGDVRARHEMGPDEQVRCPYFRELDRLTRWPGRVVRYD